MCNETEFVVQKPVSIEEPFLSTSIFGELSYSPLKSSHIENSSILFARFLICSMSEQVTADAFGNLWG
jgi:hypothetical protein